MGKSQAMEFKVGERYTNEKGVFEVLSVQGGTMVLQFENGEQISSNIDLQSRIQERRAWEQREREKKAAAGAAKPRTTAARKAAKSSAGPQPEDTKESVDTSK
jgi:hypothetical protein